MKKTLNIIIILTTLLFLSMMLSCDNNQLPTENNSISMRESLAKSTVEDCGPITEVLYAAQGFEAGYVLIDNDEDNLYVTVYSDNGYQDKEEQIKMWVGNDLIDLPQTKKSNLKIGHFPFKTTVDPNENEYTFTLSLEELGLNCDDQIFVVVHADVLLMDSQRRVRNESAFGGTAEGMFGSQWWYYMSYIICCEIPNTPPTADFTFSPESGGNTSTTFSFNGSSSSDNEDATPLLQVRWDWTNDGNYDTGFSTIQIADHLFNLSGTYTVKMEVKDTGGLTNTTTNTVTVEQGAFVVTFPDPNFEALIRETLNIPTDPITNLDMETITDMYGFTRDISDITGIEYCINIKHLYLGYNNISDISLLSNLINLIELHLYENNFSDLSPLSNLVTLEDLILGNNPITNIGPLINLTNLTRLHFTNCPIIDFNPVSNLSKLEDFAATACQFDNGDLSLLSGLINLQHLYLAMNQISNISTLSGLTNLQSIDIYINQVTNINPLIGLVNLTYLDLSHNPIIDFSPLGSMFTIQRLILYSNNISDISMLASLTNLTQLVLWRNQISDLSPLSGLMKLELLNLEENQIIDIFPLTQNSGFGNGDEINLTNNPLSTTSITTHIPYLESLGVIVYK